MKGINSEGNAKHTYLQQIKIPGTIGISLVNKMPTGQNITDVIFIATAIKIKIIPENKTRRKKNKILFN